MLRVRAIVTIMLMIGAIYALTTAARKRRWFDKLRELARALAVSIGLYWVYMFVLYYFR